MAPGSQLHVLSIPHLAPQAFSALLRTQAVSPTPVPAATVMAPPIAPLNEHAGNAIGKCESWVRGCPYRTLAEGIDMSQDNPGLRQHAEEFVQCFQSRFWQVSANHGHVEHHH